jgi:hypothetical protein
MDLIESIALANEGWSWCGKETQERVKLYFGQMGCNLTALTESDLLFPAKFYGIVDRAIGQQNHEIKVLIQQAATTKHPAHFQILQSEIEKKSSMMCLSKALMEHIQKKGSLDATDMVPFVNNATAVPASHPDLQDTSSLPPDLL